MYNTIVYLKKNTKVKRKSKCIYYEKRFSTCILSKGYCESSTSCKSYSENKKDIVTKKIKKFKTEFNINSLRITSDEKICFINNSGKIEECVLVVKNDTVVYSNGVRTVRYELNGVNKKIKVFLHVIEGELQIADMYLLKRDGCSYTLSKLKTQQT